MAPNPITGLIKQTAAAGDQLTTAIANLSDEEQEQADGVARRQSALDGMRAKARWTLAGYQEEALEGLVRARRNPRGRGRRRVVRRSERERTQRLRGLPGGAVARLPPAGEELPEELPGHRGHIKAQPPGNVKGLHAPRATATCGRHSRTRKFQLQRATVGTYL